jgi:hypothetical protein
MACVGWDERHSASCLTLDDSDYFLLKEMNASAISLRHCSSCETQGGAGLEVYFLLLCGLMEGPGHPSGASLARAGLTATAPQGLGLGIFLVSKCSHCMSTCVSLFPLAPGLQSC